MRVVLALAVASLALAGCVQAPADTVAASGLIPLPPPFVSVVSVIDGAGGQGEPSMGAHPDGTLFANGRSHSETMDGGAVFMSEDEGATWKQIAAPTEPMPNFDPDLAVARDGTVWFSSLWLGCSSTGASKDKGKTWTVSHLACLPAAGDRQYVIPTKGGEAYIYSHHLPTLYQGVARTTDYGATWMPVGFAEPVASKLTGGSGWGGGGFWNEAKDSVYFTFSYYDGPPVSLADDEWHPAAAISRADGAFELVKLPNAGGSGVGLSLVVGAADAAGNVYLAWAEAKEKQMTVYMAASTDDGKTWTSPIVVDDDPGSKVFPAITAGDAGHVAVAYYHADVQEYPSNAKDAKWNVTLAWTTDALAESPTFERTNLSNNTARTGPICPDGTSCRGNRQLLDYFALHVTPDGRVASVWTSTDEVKGKVVNIFAITTAPILRANATAAP